MTLFQVLALVLCLSAAFSYLNQRFLRFPSGIGVMTVALAATLLLFPLAHFGYDVRPVAEAALANVNFDRVLLHGMLAFLLFAGALNVDLSDLRREWGAVALLSVVGTGISTVLVGGGAGLLFRALGLPLSWTYAMLFGALISPTDPVAVMALLKRFGAPRSLETQVAGESLFNDGIGVVFFLFFLQFVTAEHPPSAGSAAALFLVEAGGGAVVGFLCGLAAYFFLKRVDDYRTEVLITLALVTGGWSIAELLHTSAPIAMVVAGLLVGNHGRTFAMSDATRRHLDPFWELVDEILNAVLFALIGLQAVVLHLAPRVVLACAFAIPLVLLARLASVFAVVAPMRRFRSFAPGAIPILTWAGLRGGISVALALSLPSDGAVNGDRESVLAITYAVVVFSILVQGLTVGPLVRRLSRGGPISPSGAPPAPPASSPPA